MVRAKMVRAGLRERKMGRIDGACLPTGAAFAAPAVIRRPSIAIVACLLAGWCLRGQTAPLQPRVIADHQEFDLASNTDILSGHVQVDYGNVQLRAEHVVINSNTRIATVTGHAELTRGPLACWRTRSSTIFRWQLHRRAAPTRRYPLYLTGRSAVNDGTMVT